VRMRTSRQRTLRRSQGCGAVKQGQPRSHAFSVVQFLSVVQKPICLLQNNNLADSLEHYLPVRQTHTMSGPDQGPPELRGITPRIVSRLFENMTAAPESVEFTLKISYVEIYMERIRDLLDRPVSLTPLPPLFPCSADTRRRKPPEQAHVRDGMLVCNASGSSMRLYTRAQNALLTAPPDDLPCDLHGFADLAPR